MNNRQLVLGTWKIGERPTHWDEEIAAIRFALSQGITHIDTAEMYGEGLSEKLVGQAIAIFQREKLYIISKVYPWNANKKMMRKSLEASLERLQTKYLDLYLLHWDDGSVNLLELIELFETFKEEGLIKAWGVSNFDTEDLLRLYALEKGSNCKANQILYNIGSRGAEYDLIPWMHEHNCIFMAYSVLGHHDRYRQSIQKSKSLKKLANKYNATIYQIMLAFALKDNTWAIAKASSIQNMKANIEALSIQLSDEDLKLLDQEFKKPTHKVPLEEI